MARKTPADPSALLTRIAAARKETAKGALLSATPMANALGWTWVNLRDYFDRDDDFPIHKRGGNGVNYEFDAHKVFDYLAKWSNAELARRKKAVGRVARLGGVDQGLVESGMSVEEAAKIDALQRETQRRKIEQRQFVPIAQVRAFLTDHLSAVQQEVDGTMARIDPAGRYPPELREGVIGELRGLLVRIHDRLEPWTRPDETARGSGTRV